MSLVFLLTQDGNAVIRQSRHGKMITMKQFIYELCPNCRVYNRGKQIGELPLGCLGMGNDNEAFVVVTEHGQAYEDRFRRESNCLNFKERR